MNEIVKVATLSSFLGTWTGTPQLVGALKGVKQMVISPFSGGIKGFGKGLWNTGAGLLSFLGTSIPGFTLAGNMLNNEIGDWYTRHKFRRDKDMEALKWGAAGLAGGALVGSMIDPKYTGAGAAVGGTLAYFGKNYLNDKE